MMKVMKKLSKKLDFKIEINFSNKYDTIAGVDEVGRGALAGPIVAAAVIFNQYDKIITELDRINDSKLLKPTQRLEMDELIKKKAIDYSIGVVRADEIDKIGIGSANVLAFSRAIKNLKQCSLAIIDGKRFHGFDYKFICVIGGDRKSISIAAASIIAKVYRDAIMQEIHDETWRYDFASNKGYGSQQHLLALKKYGPCHFHRKSFLSKIFTDSSNQKLF